MHSLLVPIFLSLLFSSAACSERISLPAERSAQVHSSIAVNINTADRQELEKLPHIGAGLAEKIVEHRTRYGPFRKKEHVLVVEGIGAERFRKFEHMIKIE